MARTPLLIDTDPGVDDALALLMALSSPDHDVLALTIAAGNVGLGHTVRNALKLLEVCQREVPVFAGCPSPLLHSAADAGYVHGRDGFGDIGYADPLRSAESEHAALAMIRLSREHAGELVLVMLGPLTNLALALKLDPQLPTRIKRLLIMGGAVTGRGNTSVPAEFNIGFDPEAAHLVMQAFPLFELVDWEATLAHPLDFGDVRRWLDAGGAVAGFYDRISAKTRAWSAHRGPHWHSADGLAMAVVLDPAGVEEAHERHLSVELEGRLYRGATLVDWDQRSGLTANACIVRRYDRARFEHRVERALSWRPA